MKQHTVHVTELVQYEVVVQADSEEQALEKAEQEFTEHEDKASLIVAVRERSFETGDLFSKLKRR